MSRTIDERVVSMQFDNRHFEQNVRTSLSTLDRLKRSLNFKGTTQGLNDINAAIKTVNFSPLHHAVDAVGVRFSALQVMAITCLQRITNAAINTGKRITSALTIDPIYTGFQEYETQINAIQTILANTQSKGTTMADVMAALNELNEYADQTIYNFTEMTRNIGTFTAAGVELETAVASIKGIANLAAVSGSNSQQAATAMYQLSQALAAGKVQLMDWNSVVNAGMGGQLFQDALKRTATQMGHNVDELIKKYGSFRESLTQGEWLTTEVLTETLKQLSGAYTEADLIAQGYTEKQAKEITELAKTATSAATDVKTFTQLMETLKESAQSGWTKTWELIVGDFEEAKKLWTGVSNTIGKIIGDSADSRNNLLNGALSTKWEQMVGIINEAGIATSTFEDKIIEVAKANKINIDSMIKEHGSLEAVFRKRIVSTEILKEAVESLNGSLVDLSGIDKELKMGDRGDDVKKIQRALRELEYDLGNFGEDGVDGIIGSYTEAAIKAFQEAQGLEITGIVDEKTLAALEKATTNTLDLTSSIYKLIDGVTELGGRELLIESFANIWNGLMSVVKPVRTAFRSIFPKLTSEQLYKFIEGFHSLTEKFKLSTKQSHLLTVTFRGIFSAFKLGGDVMKAVAKTLVKLIPDFSGLGDKVLTLTARMGTAVTRFRNWLNLNGRLTTAIKNMANVVRDTAINIRDWAVSLINMPEIQDKINGVRDAFSNTFKAVKEFLSGGLTRFQDFIERLKTLDGITLENIGVALKDFKDNVLSYFTNFDGDIIYEKVKSAFSKLKSSVVELLAAIGEKLGVTAEKFYEIKYAIQQFFDGIKNKIKDHSGAIFAVGTLLSMVYLLTKIKKVAEALGNPFEILGNIGEGITNFFDSMKNAAKTVAKAAYIKSISDAILEISIAMWVISQIEEPWKAFGVIAALSGIVVAMLVLTRLIDNKLGPGDEANVVKLGALMTSMGISLLMMTAVIKILGGMEAEDLVNATATIFGISALTLMIADFASHLNENSIKKFGDFMTKLGAALLIMSVAVWILGSMDQGKLIQGGLAVTAFLGMIAGVMIMSKTLKGDTSSFGKMMRDISIALLLLAGCVLIFGRMQTKTLIQGAIAVGAFVALILAAMTVTPTEIKRTGDFGKLMISIGGSLILMAAAVKILGSMDTRTLIKGGIAIGAFTGIVVGLMYATKLLSFNSYNAGKVGLMMLGFAGSILLITGSIAALSLLDGNDIIKALAAVAGISAIVAGLILVTKHAKDLNWSTLIGISVVIAILAGSVVALSYLGEKELITAGTIMTVLVGALSTVIKSLSSLVDRSKNIKAKELIGILVFMAGVLVLAGGLVHYLANSEGDYTKARSAAISLALIMGSLGIALGAIGLSCKHLPKDMKQVGPTLLTILGIATIVGLFTGIAIGTLPKVAEQLSTFMTKLAPFLAGLGAVDPSVTQNIKNLAQALGAFVGAGFKYSLVEWLTKDTESMPKAFKEFAKFIKKVVPVIKSIAIEISKDDVKMDTDRLNAIITAVTNLSDAAGNIPSTYGGGFASLIGAGGFFSSSNLDSFVTFIKEAVPTIKDIAIEVSKSGSFNITRLNSVMDAVSTLAQAAKDVPNLVEFGGAFGKFTGGFGGTLAGSWSGISGFGEFVSTIMDALSGFVIDTDGVEITEADTKALITMCQAVEHLGIAAGAAPTYDSIVGFGAFAGGAGVAVGTSIPGLDEFISFVNLIIPAMQKLTVDIKSSGTPITEADALILKEICQSVEYLGLAAGAAPSYSETIGLAKFAGGAGMLWSKKVPQLANFISFVTEIMPEMSDFTVDVGAKGITESDGNVVKAVCESAKILAEAANEAPGWKAAAGLMSLGALIGGGLYIEKADLTAFKDWLIGVMEVLPDFAVNVKDAKLSDDDLSDIKGVCDSVKILAEAAGMAPRNKHTNVWFGLIDSVDVPMLSSFTEWVKGIVPKMTELTSGIASAKTENGDPYLSQEDLDVIANICNSIRILGEAASYVPTSEETTTLFGLVKTVEKQTLDDFTAWIESMMTTLHDIGVKLEEGDISIDTEKLQQLGYAAAELSRGVYFFTKATHLGVVPGLDTMTLFVEELIPVMEQFEAGMADLDTTAMYNGASAAGIMADIMQKMQGFVYETVNVEGFGSKVTAIAEVMSGFESSMDGVDVSSAVTQVTAMVEAIETISGAKIDGADAVIDSLNNLASVSTDELSGLGEALSGIAESSIDDFISGFTNAGPELATAGVTMMSNLITGVSAGVTTVHSMFTSMVSKAISAISSKYEQFKTLGKNMVQGFADGISTNTFKAEAKAAAMAQKAYEAAKEALDVNSPSKIFRSLGYTVPEGFSMGIDRMGGMVKESAINMTQTAINGTKNAIARIAEAVNSDIDAQPTIRPVVDLSGVEYGARAIDGMFHMSPSMGVLTNVGTISRSMNRIQNGPNDDVISAINDLSSKLGNMSGNTYNVNGITYDDGTNVSTAVSELVRAIRVERRK